MANRGMRHYSIALSAAVEQGVNTAGDFFHVFEAADPLFASFDDGPFFEVGQGIGMRVIYDTSVRFRSATSQAIRVALGYGYVTDARASVAATITAPIQPAASNVPLADVAVNAASQAALSPAEATQLEILVGVPSAELNGVRIGDLTTDAATGLIVEPGQSIAIATREALYAYNPGAAPVTVTLLSLRSV